VHVGTNDGSVILYRVTRKQTQNNTDFFEANTVFNKHNRKETRILIFCLTGKEEKLGEREKRFCATAGSFVRVRKTGKSWLLLHLSFLLFFFLQVALTSGGSVQVMSATTLDIEETINVKNKVDKICVEKVKVVL
jgi:hypothetical protein